MARSYLYLTVIWLSAQEKINYLQTHRRETMENARILTFSVISSDIAYILKSDIVKFLLNPV